MGTTDWWCFRISCGVFLVTRILQHKHENTSDCIRSVDWCTGSHGMVHGKIGTWRSISSSEWCAACVPVPIGHTFVVCISAVHGILMVSPRSSGPSTTITHCRIKTGAAHSWTSACNERINLPNSCIGWVSWIIAITIHSNPIFVHKFWLIWSMQVLLWLDSTPVLFTILSQKWQIGGYRLTCCQCRQHFAISPKIQQPFSSTIEYLASPRCR